MADALTSFMGGLAGGYINESNRREDRERTDRLDAMREQEFMLRKQGLEGDLKDKEQARSDAADLRKEGQDVATTDVWSSDMSGMPPEERQAMAEKMSSGEMGPANGVEVGSGSERKSFLKNEGGIADAKSYASSLNDPGAKSDRVTRMLRLQGKYKEADANELGIQDHKKAMYNAGRDAIWRGISPFILNGDDAKLIDAYGHYKDGNTIQIKRNEAGGGELFQLGSKGEPIGSYKFADNADLAGKVRDALYPEEALSRVNAGKVAGAKHAAALELQGVKNQGTQTAAAIRANGQIALGSLRASSGGSSGGRGKAAAGPETPESIMSGIITTSNKDADGASKMSPEQSGSAIEFGSRFLANNPGLHPSLAASAAIAQARNPQPLLRAFDADTWTIKPAIQELVNGKKLFAGGSLAPQEADKSVYANGIQSSLDAMKPEDRGMYLRAANGDKPTATLMHNSLVNKKVAAIQADPRFTNTPAATIRDLAIREVDNHLEGRYALIRRYQSGMLLKPAGYQAPAAPPIKHQFTPDDIHLPNE
jgi:hypothetical protein